MKLPIYQIDAFTDKIFSGNPAAVCPLEAWLPDEILQNIAAENNLAETAFFIKDGDAYELRWFTPAVEVDLCGHATLAAAFVLFNHLNHAGKEIIFHSRRSGILKVTGKDHFLTLDFPSDNLDPVNMTDALNACFNETAIEIFKGRTDYMFVYESEKQIGEIQPYLQEIARLAARGVIVTARGSKADFVSRFFAPQCGINEDPVTGSAHTTLIPYWSGKLGKNELTAIQLSKRKGMLKCRYLDERVEISGQAKTYLLGEIYLD